MPTTSLILSRSCDEESHEESDSVVEVGDGEVDGESSDEEETSEEAAASDEETEEAGERKGNAGSREGIDWEALTLEQQQQRRQPRRIRGILGILRLPQTELARVFQSISLDGFTLLSTGTTSKPQEQSEMVSAGC